MNTETIDLALAATITALSFFDLKTVVRIQLVLSTSDVIPTNNGVYQTLLDAGLIEVSGKVKNKAYLQAALDQRLAKLK